jgi:hypothetical protein
LGNEVKLEVKGKEKEKEREKDFFLKKWVRV